MPDSGEGRFVGAIPAKWFLDYFMLSEDEVPAAPEADFSKVPSEGPVGEICRQFIRAVEKYKIFPGNRLFLARTTRRRAMEELPDAQPVPPCNRGGHQVDDGVQRQWVYPCPPISARAHNKASPRKGGKGGNVEYYDFSSALLDIEVENRLEADPFVDPQHYPQSPASSSRRGSPSSVLQASTGSSHAEADTSGRDERPEEAKSLSPSGSTPAPRATSVEEQERGNSPLSSSTKSSYYEPFESPSEHCKAFRASIVSHAAAQFSRQHRTFLFQLILVQNFARFIRWDHSGAIVSERFDYIAQPQLLAEFFWYFAHMDDEERGFDSTVRLATKAERKIFEDAVQAFLHDMKVGTKDGRPFRTLPDAELSLDDTDTFPTWVVRVSDAVTRKSTQLVLRRPFSSHATFLGRATRAYIAYDVQARRLVFLKDTWRVVDPRLPVESKMYRELQRHSIPHVPQMLHGGDVRDEGRRPHATVTDIYSVTKAFWRITDGTHDSLIHHRIVQNIAFPLESVVNEREFLQVLHDVSLAISKAYHEAGLLHRDVSAGNVMISSDGRGVLNDWDHAGKKDELCAGIGTWRFMSIPLLMDPNHIHDIAEDLESLYWVFLYGILKLFAVPPQTGLLFEVLDHKMVDASGQRTGGNLKAELLNGAILRRTQFTSENLRGLVEELTTGWWSYHRVVAEDPWLETQPVVKAMCMQMLNLVVKPEYWVDHFATALQQCVSGSIGSPAEKDKADIHSTNRTTPDSCLSPILPSQPQGKHPEVTAVHEARSTTNKRKACAMADDKPLRRSKRLRKT